MIKILTADSLSIFWDIFLKQFATASANYNSSLVVSWDTIALLPLKLFVVIFISLLLISKLRKFTYKHLKSLALFTFLSGVAIYGIGFNTGGCHNNYLALGWRACLSSIEMFTTHSDLIEVDHELHHDPLYMTIFCIIHFLAVCVSAIAIVKLFGYQLYSWIKSSQIRLIYKWNNKIHRLDCMKSFYIGKLHQKKIFVFWGVNNNAITLAESIFKNLSQQAILIFVALPSDNKHGSAISRFTFSHFFHSSNESISNYIDRLELMDAILMNANIPVNAYLLKSVKSAKDFYSHLQLKNLGNILQCQPSTQEVNYYFLSDDEYENVEAVSAFKLLYAQQKDDSSPLTKIHLYCHARKNSFNDKLLLKNNLSNCKVEIVDSSLLSVRQLKKDLKSQPISFVEKDCEQGLVLSHYHALIIGFNKIGRDALRYLYEFASFLGENGQEDMKHFYITDDNLQYTKTIFLNSAPALQQKSCIEWWDNAPVKTPLFWEKLKNIINQINQIIICVDDDEEAKILLSQLCDFAYKYRTDFHNFQIQIKIKDDLYSDQVKRFSKNLSEKTCDFIRVFGSTTSIFNYNVFSVELLEREAKEFYYQYKYISNAFENSGLFRDYMTRYLQSNTAEDVWERRIYYKDTSVRKDENGNDIIVDNVKRKTIEDNIELHYQEEQDYSNAWHKFTKCALVGITIENDKVAPNSLPRFKEMLKLMTRDEENKYPNIIEEKDILLMDNLSGCEHLRWAAKMELLGFVYKPGRKSLKAGTNACIVSYADLKLNPDLAYTIAYDSGVVELSFNSFKKNMNSLT